MGLTVAQLRDSFVDENTKQLNVIDYPHHEIHGGSAFMLYQVTALNALDIASPLSYRIRCPAGNKHAHMTIEADVAASAVLEMFEENNLAGHYTVTGGTLVRPINRNRNSSNSSIVTCHFGVTITNATPQCRIYGRRIGGFRAIGSTALRHELVLAAGGDYLVRLTSDADNNEGSLNLEWYEHTDRS